MQCFTTVVGLCKAFVLGFGVEVSCEDKRVEILAEVCDWDGACVISEEQIYSSRHCHHHHNQHYWPALNLTYFVHITTWNSISMFPTVQYLTQIGNTLLILLLIPWWLPDVVDGFYFLCTAVTVRQLLFWRTIRHVNDTNLSIDHTLKQTKIWTYFLQQSSNSKIGGVLMASWGTYLPTYVPSSKEVTVYKKFRP